MTFTLHNNFFRNLEKALKDKSAYTLVDRKIDGSPHPQFHIHYLNDGYFSSGCKTSRATEMAVAIALRELVESDPTQQGLIPCTRKFLASVSPLCDQRPFIELRAEYLAQRFNLPTSCLLKHPEFMDFLENNHLYRILDKHGHQIGIDSDTGEPLILSEGVELPWSLIVKNFPMTDRHVLVAHMYKDEGLVEGTSSQWTEWKPFRKEDPAEWDKQYVMDICCNCTDSPENLTGDHSWFRLRNPDGDVYSVGLYRDGKNTAQDHYQGSTSIKPAYLYSPDISEYHPAPYVSWQFAISEEDFEAIKAAVELDKELGVYFHILRYNCTHYTKEKASLASAKIPTSLPAARVLFSRIPGVVPLADAALPYLTDLGRKAADVGVTLLINTVQYGLGGASIHPDSKVAEHMPKPVLSTASDWLDRENVQMHHPFVMGRVIEKKVKTWREAEILNAKTDAERQEIMWALPPDMRVQVQARL